MVELESEGELSRTEVADFLREFADELDDTTEQGQPYPEGRGDEVTEESLHGPKRITLIVGGDSATVTVPRTIEFDVEVESRSPMLSSGVRQDVEFELSWKIDNPDELNEDWLEVE
jgi:hypothetical protein